MRTRTGPARAGRNPLNKTGVESYKEGFSFLCRDSHATFWILRMSMRIKLTVIKTTSINDGRKAFVYSFIGLSSMDSNWNLSIVFTTTVHIHIPKVALVYLISFIFTICLSMANPIWGLWLKSTIQRSTKHKYLSYLGTVNDLYFKLPELYFCDLNCLI